MKLSENGVRALHLAAKIALGKTHGTLTEHARAEIQELYERAADALENWTYDRTTEQWSVKRK